MCESPMGVDKGSLCAVLRLCIRSPTGSLMGVSPTWHRAWDPQALGKYVLNDEEISRIHCTNVISQGNSIGDTEIPPVKFGKRTGMVITIDSGCLKWG